MQCWFIFNFCCLFVLLYIILKEKNKINFLTIFKAIVIGFIIAGFLGFLRPVSERLQNVLENLVIMIIYLDSVGLRNTQIL